MGEFPIGKRRPTARGRRPGWLHGDCPAEPKPPGKLAEGKRAGAAPRQYRSAAQAQGDRRPKLSWKLPRDKKWPLWVHQQQKKDQTKQGPAAQQVEKTSGKGHEKAQAVCLFRLGLYRPGILMGLSGKGLGKGVR